MNKYPVTLRWSETYGQNIAITGSFWGWGEPKPIQDKKIALSLVPGIYEFKFLVDGHWETSDSYPNVRTYLGDNIRNNVIEVDTSRAAESSQNDDVIQVQSVQSAQSAPSTAQAGPTELESMQAEQINELFMQVEQLRSTNSDLQRNLGESQAQQLQSQPDMMSNGFVNVDGAAPHELEQKERTINELNTKLHQAHTQIQTLQSSDVLNSHKQQEVVITELTHKVQHLSSQNQNLDTKLSDFKNMYAQTAFGLSLDEVNKYRAAFDLFDENKDGKITRQELEHAIQECGLKPNAAWVQELIKEADEDDSGTIEWPEFLHAMTRHVNEAQKKPAPKSQARSTAPAQKKTKA